MNNLIKSAARKHALANGIATSKWTDDDFEAYIAEHGITEADNLKSVDELSAASPKVDAPVSTPAGDVEKAIAELVAGLTPAQQPINEAAVVKLIEKHSLAPRVTVVEVRDGEKVVAKIDGAHRDTATVMGVIASGVNIAAVGPPGSGKSTMFRQIAETLGLDYYITGAVQQESKVMGYNDANGKYLRTPFRDAFEHGGLFVMEEFDGSSAKALLAINNAVANEVSDFPDGMVKRHKDFVIVMAGNTFGTGASRQYVGRSQIDAATLDRFAFIDIGYDEALEMQITLAENADAAGWVQEVQAFRAKVEKAGIRHVVSPRASIMGAKMLKQGLPLDVIRKMVLHKSLTTDQIKQLSK